MTPRSIAAASLYAHSIPGLVSVIIPFYKQEAFLEDALRSVEQQSYPYVEIIVVDDGSPKSAASILGSRQNVTILRTENRGCPSARNYGFKKSSGEYLLFLDSDDRLAPSAIERHLKALQQHPGAVLGFGAARIIDECNHEICRPRICRPQRNYFLMFLEGNPIACPGAALMRRSAFIEAGLFDESFRIVEDYRLYLQLTRRHRITRVDSYVVDYRLHPNSASQDKEAMLKATMSALDCIESEFALSSVERRRLRHGRRRWIHAFRPKNTLRYKAKSLYFRFRSIFGTPLAWYLRRTC